MGVKGISGCGLKKISWCSTEGIIGCSLISSLSRDQSWGTVSRGSMIVILRIQLGVVMGASCDPVRMGLMGVV